MIDNDLGVRSSDSLHLAAPNAKEVDALLQGIRADNVVVVRVHETEGDACSAHRSLDQLEAHAYRQILEGQRSIDRKCEPVPGRIVAGLLDCNPAYCGHVANHTRGRPWPVIPKSNCSGGSPILLSSKSIPPPSTAHAAVTTQAARIAADIVRIRIAQPVTG